MSISLYFGSPGCGKTTMLASIALRESKRKPRRYENIYSNVPLKIDGVTYIDNDCIGKYDICNALVLIDEATLFANNRDWKKFGYDKTEFFLLHRHFNIDIIFFAQVTQHKSCCAVFNKPSYQIGTRQIGKMPFV